MSQNTSELDQAIAVLSLYSSTHAFCKQTLASYCISLLFIGEINLRRYEMHQVLMARVLDDIVEDVLFRTSDEGGPPVYGCLRSV